MINSLLVLLGVVIFSAIIGVITYFIIEALHPKKKISGGCNVTRWGCCLDGITPKLDSLGTNCVLGS